MPRLWFRRRRHASEEQPPQVIAPAPQPDQPVTPPAEAAKEQPTPRKRRRGSRGGRGRKKPAAAQAQAQPTQDGKPGAEPAAKPAPKEQPKRERRPARRREPIRRPPLPKAKRELLVSVDVGEQRVAVLEDDRIAEVYLERPERRSIAGNIYLGTVDNVLPGMEAAFVEIGLEKNGFLYVDEIVAPELEGKRQGRRIQDLIQRGQEVLVQAVKDPMKTKGARLTTEISLPGRFVVFVPTGEGTGVSRRLDDDERARLKEIIKKVTLPEGGVIVRTAAEGASAEDIERDLVFLQRLWKTIQQRAKEVKPPALVYQEAELPLRVTRDLFTDDFERALVDDDTAFKRIVGYLKKTSPHMVERVVRYKDKQPLGEALGLDAEIRSMLSRRVDLPSGGYLVFDYAEAFTVIDVNTGRYVGSRSKSSGGRLEDTITKNNLEAVKEVVRQLRLRDIGGIIVIDFIDMANPKNRATVEEALRTELERDRTKTYVVEISPLGLVEMTRQNVTDGPREILTKRCPTCDGDGIIVSETTMAVELERRLRSLASAKPRMRAFQVEVAARPGSVLIGPGASRLMEIERQTRRRFYLELREGVHTDHFAVLAEGAAAEPKEARPIDEGAEVEVKPVEVGLHDPDAGIAKLDGYDVSVANAAKLVGKKVKARVNRVLGDTVFAVPVDATAIEAPITAEAQAEKPTRGPRKAKAVEAPAASGATAEETESEAPITAEAQAEKPTRGPRKAKAVEAPKESGATAEEAKTKKPTPAPRKPKTVVEREEAKPKPEAEVSEAAPEGEAEAKPKKRTRRGTRGGRGRKRKTAVAATAANGKDGVAQRDGAPKIHLPDPALGAEAALPAESSEPSSDGAPPAEGERPKKRTRRGSRGGRRRRKTGATASSAGSTDAASGEPPSKA